MKQKFLRFINSRYLSFSKYKKNSQQNILYICHSNVSFTNGLWQFLFKKFGKLTKIIDHNFPDFIPKKRNRHNFDYLYQSVRVKRRIKIKRKSRIKIWRPLKRNIWDIHRQPLLIKGHHHRVVWHRVQYQLIKKKNCIFGLMQKIFASFFCNISCLVSSF